MRYDVKPPLNSVAFSFIFKQFLFFLTGMYSGKENVSKREAHMCGSANRGGGREERKSFVSVLPLRDESKCWLCLKLLGCRVVFGLVPLPSHRHGHTENSAPTELPLSDERINLHWGSVKLQCQVFVRLLPHSVSNYLLAGLWRRELIWPDGDISMGIARAGGWQRTVVVFLSALVCCIHWFWNKPSSLAEQVCEDMFEVRVHRGGEADSSHFLFTVCISEFLSLCGKGSGFMQRTVITDLNGVKMETSSGHTLTCQPHFLGVDAMSAAVQSLTTAHLSFLFLQLLLHFHVSVPSVSSLHLSI